MSYIFIGGFRLVVPYLFTMKKGVQLAWIGRKIDEVLSEYFQFLSSGDEEGLQKVFDGRRLTVNGRLVRPNYILSAKDTIELLVHMHEPEVLDCPIRLLHVDDDIIVVDKPSSIPVHPIGMFKFNTVLRILADEHPELAGRSNFLASANRLDRQTSGLLLLARNQRVAARFFDCFTKRSVRKEYLARVKGTFPEGRVEVNQPIEQKTFIPPLLYGVSPEGKRAVTIFERESVAEDGSESIVHCRPVTGRTHQIRIHLQWLGHPISNDFKYGGDFNVNKAYNSNTPKVTDYPKITWCSLCNSSEHEFRDVPLADRGYCIWLHSFRYSSEEPSDSWTFEAPRPTWTDLSTR